MSLFHGVGELRRGRQAGRQAGGQAGRRADGRIDRQTAGSQTKSVVRYSQDKPPELQAGGNIIH